jgi:hypothetical protein
LAESYTVLTAPCDKPIEPIQRDLAKTCRLLRVS